MIKTLQMAGSTTARNARTSCLICLRKTVQFVPPESAISARGAKKSTRIINMFLITRASTFSVICVASGATGSTRCSITTDKKIVLRAKMLRTLL